MHRYGLAAAQLSRLRAAGIRITVAVDLVAASGGYLIACVADKVIASPFAYIGSIGVVAEFPNINRWLRKQDIDFLTVTAGKFKRTLTPFGEVTEEAKGKFEKDLIEVHDKFKQFVAYYRGQHRIPDTDVVSTGEVWLAVAAIDKGLVDELVTSDDYIRAKMLTHECVELSPVVSSRESLLGRIMADLSDALLDAADRRGLLQLPWPLANASPHFVQDVTTNVASQAKIPLDLENFALARATLPNNRP